MFDSDAGSADLAAIRSIEVRGFRGRASSETMLFAGWLVSRLGYSLADLDGDEETIRATLYDGTRGVTLAIGRGWSPDRMSHVRIVTDGAELELEAHEMSHHLHVIERRNGDEDRRTVEQGRLDHAFLIRSALGSAAEPRIAAEAAAAALALLGE
jgi:hypothetical protein